MRTSFPPLVLIDTVDLTLFFQIFLFLLLLFSPLSLVCFPLFLIMSYCHHSCPLIHTSFFSIYLLPLCITHVRSLIFNLFSNSKKISFFPPWANRHITVMYHPASTVPKHPPHWGHFDLPKTNVTVIMSQDSGVVNACSLWLRRTPIPNGTKSFIICYAWAFHGKL